MPKRPKTARKPAPKARLHPMYRRRKADQDTVVRSGVGVLIRDAKGRILLERRSDCGFWGIPGGSVAPGESVERTAVREALEETGLAVRVTGIYGVYSDGRTRLVTFPERVVQLVDTIVEAEITGGRLRISSESLELAFFSLNKLPPDIVPPAMEILKDLRAGRTGVLR